jgi:hypothetical protein
MGGNDNDLWDNHSFEDNGMDWKDDDGDREEGDDEDDDDVKKGGGASRGDQGDDQKAHSQRGLG